MSLRTTKGLAATQALA